MKVRDSGMPEQSYWESLFNIPLILEKMKINKSIDILVEFGCGYGTFTLPSAKTINGKVIAFDIEDSMLENINARIISNSLNNIFPTKRDFITEGTGLEDQSVDYVMLFNILHHTDPLEILNEAFRILKTGGKAGLVHWNYDPTTPRGPNMDIRPKPIDLLNWALSAGFQFTHSELLDLPPYHYGYIGYKR